jgi:SARP family transcriptional regulator, regulator of embCAB operon
VLEQKSIRIRLAGRVTIEVDECLVDQAEFPGIQGRTAFAFLAAERSRPVTRGELIEALWPIDAPPSCESALHAIVSKLRTLLTRAGLDHSTTLVGTSGCYELRLPAHAWVDLEAAADAIHEAEVALRAGDPGRAYGPSAVAHHIARRPFLPGAEGHWLDAWRMRLRNILLRALECRGEVYLWNREFSLAIEAANELMVLEPLRESGHRLLMRGLADAGNTAEALNAYERCRQLIARQLGVDPSKQTKAVYEALLSSV